MTVISFPKTSTVVDSQTLQWNQGDIFVVPAWHWHSHENRAEGDSILFSMTDAPAFMHSAFTARRALANSELPRANVLLTSLKALNRYQIERGLMKRELDITSLFVRGTI